MYEIIMLTLAKDRVASLICNGSQISEVLDFVKGEKGRDPEWIIDQIESNFDCREVECYEEDPFELTKPEEKELPESSQKFIVYINYNNGSEQSLFGYPTLAHARIVGNKFITENGTVKIYESDNSVFWGSMKLVETVKYNKNREY